MDRPQIIVVAKKYISTCHNCSCASMAAGTHVAGENFVMFRLTFFLKLIHLFFFYYSLRATRGARSPNLQVVITHASHVCSQRSFGLPLRMNGMRRTQFDHAPLDILSLVI